MGPSVGLGVGSLGAVGSKGSAPCRREKRASRKLAGGADSAGENILGRRVCAERKGSADLRFGVLDHVVGEARGEVYLPPTPLRPGASHRRVPESSVGFV